jgi:hypothetical protein
MLPPTALLCVASAWNATILRDARRGSELFLVPVGEQIELVRYNAADLAILAAVSVFPGE